MRYNITISGMGCRHCVARVTKALTELGVNIISVEINSAVVEYEGDIDRIRSSIEELGFAVVSIEAV